jgi:uncharacterized membrane protein
MSKFAITGGVIFTILSVVLQGQSMNLTSSQSEKKLALVIGNGNYAVSILSNPENDARAMADVLRKLGFIVIEYENLNQAQIKYVIDDFGLRLKGNDVGLFYYAGHGIQAKGYNYLIPVDAQLKTEEQVEYDCVRADRILALMETSGTKINIIILDACRNNPFERSWTRSTTGKGLAFMSAPRGTLIAYATAPGSTASDGSGMNGLYTSALLESIQIPDLTIIQMFQNVRNIVTKKSNDQQTPWESTSLTADFYFNRSAGVNNETGTFAEPSADKIHQQEIELQGGDYSGTYTCNLATGQIMTLVLKSDENGSYSGTISDNSISYKVSAQIQNRTLTGYYGEGASAVHFNADINNQYLTFTIAVKDYLGNSNPMVLNFIKSGGTINANNKLTDPIIINNRILTAEQLQELKTRYGVEPRPGNYWYDSTSGLYGVTGYPSYGFMYPGHNFGPLSRNASAGNTGVIINGRELPQLEWAVWSYILGYYIQQGNYWFDSQGNAGYVGSNIPVVNLFAAARQNSYSGQGGSGDNFWSSRFGAGNSNADNSQGYVSVPGYGPVGYGF